MQQGTRKRIGIFFSPDVVWHRGVLTGIQEYALQQGGWDFLLANYGGRFVGEFLTGEQSMNLDGAIGDRLHELESPALADVPSISLSPYQSHKGTPSVCNDMMAVGRIAAEDLLNLGLSRFLTLTTAEPNNVAAVQRIDGFCQRIEQAGHRCEVLTRGPRTLARERWHLEDQLADLADMIERTPKPLGLFAVDVPHAWRAYLVCREHGYQMPNDVALICGGDDDIVFETLHPTITGVLYDKERVGYLAAQTLDRLISGEKVPATQPVAPLGVMARQTTEFIAVEDPVVEKAVRYIWQHTGDALAVCDVLTVVQVSERTLHRRFKQHLGRTPADEIRRARFETARRLLTTTDMPLVEVATRAGFGEQSQLSRAIKENTGRTPTELRKQFRGR